MQQKTMRVSILSFPVTSAFGAIFFLFKISNQLLAQFFKMDFFWDRFSSVNMVTSIDLPHERICVIAKKSVKSHGMRLETIFCTVGRCRN